MLRYSLELFEMMDYFHVPISIIGFVYNKHFIQILIFIH